MELEVHLVCVATNGWINSMILVCDFVPVIAEQIKVVQLRPTEEGNRLEYCNKPVTVTASYCGSATPVGYQRSSYTI